MDATVDLILERSDRQFVLPASGTRSFLFRFVDATFGGMLTSAGDEDFKPGGTYVGATLDLWHADGAAVATGAKFAVWYDGDIGQGVVTSTPKHP